MMTKAVMKESYLTFYLLSFIYMFVSNFIIKLLNLELTTNRELNISAYLISGLILFGKSLY